MGFWDRKYFIFFIIFYFGIIGVDSITTPISNSEANLLYSNDIFSPVSLLSGFTESFISGIAGVRVISFLLGILNAYLMWLISKKYFSDIKERRFAFVIYLLIPGVIASNVILTSADYALTITLLLIYAWINDIKWLKIVTLLLIFPTSIAVFSLYLGVAVYSYIKEERKIFYISLILFFCSLLVGNFNFNGKPRGYFLDLIAIYSALFSPLFFLYYLYAIYRAYLDRYRDFLWYLATVSLIVSFIFSIRQHILIVDFSPYLLPAGILVPFVYLKSLKVRLKPFQKAYKRVALIVLLSMILIDFIMLFHIPIYIMLKKPDNYFARPLYYPYELAVKLKKEGKNCYFPKLIRKKDTNIMKFYGLKPCN